MAIVEDSYIHPDDAPAVTATRKKGAASFKRRNWFARIAPGVVFALLGLLVHFCSKR